ncbi:MAG: CHAT domain-containing protein [Prochloraceae cyanobacterium]|nr:CHAT domain-containing protein [Prochloraceae cyanobacterium]
MNSERREAYRNLIDALLNCNEGEERELLQAHQELLDSDLIQEMEQVVQKLKEKGDSKRADFLQNLADSLVSTSVYQEIIEKLLNCASEDEALQILDANRDWVDAGLTQTMLEVGKDLINQGDLDKCNFLMNIVEQLMGVGGDTSDAQLNFLLQVLQATAESKSNPKIVYSLLQKNLDKLDETFIEIFCRWAITTLLALESEKVYNVARVIFEFSRLIEQFPFGNRSINLEIAIKGYRVVAAFVTLDAFPYEWATTQYNLGTTYENRSEGDKAENIETAITCLRESLKVFTPDAFPYEWARAKNNLGNAYSDRIRGEKAENIETAISCFRESLRIYTPNLFPYNWAGTQTNLGNAYRERIKGEKAENIETAIACFRESLRIYTLNLFPYNWAGTQTNLGNAYRERIKGEKAENIETAIACFRESLKVYTSDSFPAQWAMNQYGLGDAYGERIKGEKAENIETAIACFRESLKVYTLEAFPEEWARSQYNLGNAYGERIKGEKAENIETAIACFRESLKVYTLETFPRDWASTQNNLGNAYSHRIKGETADNLEAAIDCFRESLKVCTLDTFPYEWASTQNNLGNAYGHRIKGETADNLEAAIDCFRKSLKVYTLETFPREWANTQNNLGNAYKDRIKGEKADNLEAAISCYQKSLKVYTLETFPYEWARTQNNLGSAYSDRIKGEKADNLEAAISCYQKSLKVYTLETFPYEWANTQNNLGIAYRDRIKGETADNLEAAISCYQKSLKVLTPEAFPRDWARTQNNLGIAYWDRIKGEKADNLEVAISCCQKSLKVLTPEAFPRDWAVTQNDLGIAYSDRIKGEKADNLEAAISCYQKSLKVYTLETFPYEWANTQNNLGSAYSRRIKGETADNLEAAISCYQKSLKVYTPEAFPREWAMTQNNLGIAYSDRIKGKKADNLEATISCYQKSLTVYTPEAFPRDWAMMQNNLGNAYSERIKGETADNLEAAISCYQKSLKVYTLETFPYDWANTQNNLGRAYSKRIKGETADNLEAAISCYQKSLKVYTPEAFPRECLRTGGNLGDLAFQQENWQVAIDAYKNAIEAVEISHSWAMTPQSKQDVMEAAINVYYRIVQACLNTKHTPRALEYVERSKTRNLVQLITTRDLKPRGDFSPDILTELDRLRNTIRTEQIYLANQERKYNYNALSELDRSSPPSPLDRTRLKQLQQELDQLIERDISPIDPTFSLTQKVQPLPLSDIKSLMDECTAIVEWYITREKILAFLVTPHRRDPKVWQSSTENLIILFNWVKEYLRTYDTNRQQWRTELETRLPKLAEILHLDEIISSVPVECDRLILIPHRFLHLLPLHALPGGSQKSKVKSQNFNTSEYLLDLFPRGVQYAPSCQLLKLTQSQQRRDFRNLFAIQNPTDDLVYTDLEVEAICSYFQDSKPEVLASQDASKAALKVNENFKTAHCVHFSCHGYFDPASPLESALRLAESKKTESNEEKSLNDDDLTLAEIFELSLPQCRLVTLSACETGIPDVSSISDEYMGLPSAFLVAGSPAVVASLWKVNDLSTALLMIKFYENLRHQMSLAVALNQSQIWLRDATKVELQQWIEKLSLNFVQKYVEIQPQFYKFNPSDKPFKEPFHWAAFCAIGQ